MKIPLTEEKLEKIFFCFSGNCIWIKNWKLSQSGTEYLPSAVNVLTITPKISKFKKEDIFHVIYPHSDQK